LCESGDLILDTIKSRCQIHKLSPLNIEDMREYINLYFKEFDEKMINSALAYAGGVPGKVEDFFNNKNLEILRGIICNLLVDINKGDKVAVITYEKKLASFKENWEEILNILLSFIRDISVYKEVENKELIINGDKLHEIDNISREMTFRKLKGMVKVLDRTRSKLNSNTNFLLTLNVMIIDLMEV
jgi:DNA polymerase-3 subunit delta'